MKVALVFDSEIDFVENGDTVRFSPTTLVNQGSDVKSNRVVYLRKPQVWANPERAPVSELSPLLVRTVVLRSGAKHGKRSSELAGARAD